MNEQNKKQIYMLGGLGAALVAVFVYQFIIVGTGPTKSGGSRTTAQKASQQTANAVFRDVEIDPLAMSEMVIYTPPKYSRLRNLMEPMVFTVVEGMGGAGGVVIEREDIRDKVKNVREKNVSAIIYDNVRPVAIVDNEVVETGYVYPDGIVKIYAIEPDKVIFEVEQMRVPVEIKEL